MKLLLTSAGITNQTIADELQNLVGKPLSETTLLFVPTAANLCTEDKGWLIDNILEFRDQKFKSFDMLDIAGQPEAVWQPRFEAADVICCGGGDETYLSRILQEQNVKASLLPLLESKVYMGISAGSMVAGIGLPKGVDPELYGEEDFESDQCIGMELCNFSYIPHFDSPAFKRLRAEVLDTYTTRFKNTVIATDDQTAISVTDDQMKIVGDGTVWKHEV